MACKVVFAERFLEDASHVWSERLRLSLANVFLDIEAFPETGLKSLPLSIKEEFGGDVRKAAVSLFGLIDEFKKRRERRFRLRACADALGVLMA